MLTKIKLKNIKQQSSHSSNGIDVSWHSLVPFYTRANASPVNSNKSPSPRIYASRNTTSNLFSINRTDKPIVNSISDPSNGLCIVDNIEIMGVQILSNTK
jgi:hypothetical protein